MSRNRVAAALLLLLLGPVLAAIGAAQPATAQTSSAAVTLVSQTPWTTLKNPVLEVTVRLTNTGEVPLDDLTIGATIGLPIRSRNAYETSLTEGPGTPILAITDALAGTLEPGQERRAMITIDLSESGGISAVDSLVYPMRVDLRSQSTPVAWLDTPVIVVVRRPEKPLLLTWTIELTAPIAFDARGALADPDFEASVSPGGALASEIEALRRLAVARPAPVELVIQPSLLEQLARMAGGYTTTEGERVRAGTATAAAAAAELDVLRQVAAAPGVRVIALPFAGATVPSLISSGLTGDVSVQRDLGDETVRDLLGVTPSTAVVRPTNGDLSAPAVAAMADAGATVLLVDSDTVDRPVQPNEFAPLPTATLASEGRTVAAVLPDPGTQTLIGSPAFEGDPVRAAQATLGELATIWREQPVPTLPRGVAILLPSSLQAGFWNPFLRRVAEAPFLSPQPADDLIDLVPPPDSASELAHPSTSSFTSGYADSIKDERRNVAALRSMLSLANPLANRLSRNLLYAESVAYLGAEESGRLWIDHVHDRAFETFEAAAPDTSQVFTFLQRSGTIPIQMGDPGPTPIRVMLQLRSAQFQFPDGDQQTVTLTQPDQIVTFHATATTSGRSQIQVIVRAPSGRPIEQGILVVRTTAVNRIALIITVAAALVLVALWSRRYLQRPTT